jgi:hypothetical protein
MVLRVNASRNQKAMVLIKPGEAAKYIQDGILLWGQRNA